MLQELESKPNGPGDKLGRSLGVATCVTERGFQIQQCAYFGGRHDPWTSYIARRRGLSHAHPMNSGPNGFGLFHFRRPNAGQYPDFES